MRIRNRPDIRIRSGPVRDPVNFDPVRSGPVSVGKKLPDRILTTLNQFFIFGDEKLIAIDLKTPKPLLRLLPFLPLFAYNLFVVLKWQKAQNWVRTTSLLPNKIVPLAIWVDILHFKAL